jgi:diguanylate cyclase (GGDEF)-like protein/PAS domain S-box-containing protein
MRVSKNKTLLFVGVVIIAIESIVYDHEISLFQRIALTLGLFALIMLIIHFWFERIVTVLDEANVELSTILATSKDGIAILDLQTNFLFTNKSYLTMTGFTKEELLTKSCAGLSAPEDVPRAIKAIEEAIEKGFVENFEKTCIMKDGKRVIVNMAIALMPDKQRLLITTKNVTEAKKIEREVEKYIKLIDENVIASSTDLEGTITYASEAFCAISGYSKNELIGQNHRIVWHEDMSAEMYKEMRGSLIKDRVWEGELKNKKRDGSYYWVYTRIYPLYDDEGVKYGYTTIRADITDKKRIEEISITDGLTSIYNRRYFDNIFPKFIQSARRNNSIASFIFMDVDHFKLYNDTYGHQKGDDVLVQVAQFIKNTSRRGDDYCFRLGGEEFGVLFKSQSRENALEFAEILRNGIEHLSIVHEKNSASVFVTVSMGLVILDSEAFQTCDIIYKQSDDLLYKAKRLGRNQICTIPTNKEYQ